jgi:uncharacterized protein DUF4238
MADPRKHHFSPVFYLRGWCDSNNTVVEYSRPHQKVVARNVPPTATGYKPFLYTLEGQPDDKKQSIEKDYMAPIVDDRAAQALRALLGGDRDALTEKMREAWTRFIMASLLRRPQSVSEIADGFKAVLRHNLLDSADYESMREADDPSTAFEWLEKNHPHYINDAAKQMVVRAVEHEGVGNIIMNMRWSTLDFSRSRHEVLTADMPHIRFHGLKDPRCTILFPLNPEKVFIATHDRKSEGVLVGRDPTQVVAWLNDNLVRVAERYVFGRTKSHLQFVENRLGRFPASTLLGNRSGTDASTSLPAIRV